MQSLMIAMRYFFLLHNIVFFSAFSQGTQIWEYFWMLQKMITQVDVSPNPAEIRPTRDQQMYII